ncbi:nuclease-related domain-containing protein [Cytobacillus dafuensis]|uniref:NERD domain-containing protein n=1 Tax=Cytobacillus dafuensis TaxID=1742359 RepID=A0A5B8Z9K5_CYTDA|nr:nuclease-related domain-containing protein [Cytobacillus dafuensis]QED49660.1 NERD domain-containing protein [Cytobacillus dafuensis]
MIVKFRSESKELKLLRSLDSRMKLSVKDKNHFENLEKGFKGEKKFDDWIEEFFHNDCLILNDLLFDMNNTIFQVDSLLMSSDKALLIEVKNFEGDHYIEAERWYMSNGIEIQNPLHQVKRAETNLRRIFQAIGCNVPIESYLLFINPNFHLYQAPRNTPIIFPTQLNRFMKKLNKPSPPLKEIHHKFAERLVSLHLNDPPYKRLPIYSYDQLEKGIVCGSCFSFFEDFQTNRKDVICKECGYKENVKSAILRSVDEFRLLFPKENITTHAIHDWCKVIKAKKVIWRILTNNFKVIGQSRSTYFVDL